MSKNLTIEEINERLSDRVWKCVEWLGTKNNNTLKCELCDKEYIGKVDFRRFPPKCSCEWGIGVQKYLKKHNFKFLNYNKSYVVQCNECKEIYVYKKDQIKNKKYLCSCERFKEYENNLKSHGYNYKIKKSKEEEKVDVICLDCNEKFTVRTHCLTQNENGELKKRCECVKVRKHITKEDAQERLDSVNADIILKEWNGTFKYANGLCIECGELVETNYGLNLYTKDKYGFFVKKCSCKKIMSKGEIKVAETLKELGIDYINEKTYDDLISDSNRKLRYDFYIPSLNTLIEYDGEYHFKNDDEEKLKIQQRYDLMKNEYAKKNNINLIRIPYWEYKNIQKILKNLKIGT